MDKGSAQKGEGEPTPRGLAAAFLPTLLVLLIVIAAAVLADRQNHALFRSQLRAAVAADLEPIRSALEIAINTDIQLLRGIAAAVSAEPEAKPDHFARLAESVFRDGAHLRSLAYAPGFVVSEVFPQAGNTAALGLDYRTDPKQSAAAMRVRDEKRLVVAGPLPLKQGGIGLVARYPIFAEDAAGNRAVTGILSGVLDIEAIYRDAGLLSADAIEIAISGRNGDPADTFFGEPALLKRDPVAMTIDLPGGNWTIRATPASGWETAPPNQPIVRMLLGLAGLLVIVPTFVTSLLLQNRQTTLAVLSVSQARLQALSHRLGLALASSQTGIWELDVDRGSVLWDEKMYELYGKQKSFQPSRGGWETALHPEDAPATLAALTDALETNTTFQARFRIRLDDGGTRHIRAVGTLDPSAGRRVMVGVNWDVTAETEKNERLDAARRRAVAQSEEIERARRQMEYNALHDSLTGLANRRALDQALAQMPAEGAPLTLLHIDLDRFKEINDTGGHAAGDAVLCHTARILDRLAGPHDTVGRIGGDEFLILRRGADAKDSEALAAEILSAMSEPMVFEGQEIRLAVSIGLAHHQQGQPLDQLLVEADLALYEAKRRGRSRAETFSPTLKTAALTTRRTADDILRGLENDDFIAYYQPQFCPQTLALTGVEALARWKHPTRGLLTPQSFLKTAESINVVARIDQRILEQTLTQARLWDAAGLHVPKISVNISRARLGDEQLKDRLSALSIPKGRLSFELLESIFFDEDDRLLFDNVLAIKELGIDIEIDDFGSGYASITSLLKLTPRRLKIDRKLVTPMLESPRQRRLVSSIVDIGKSLGIEVIAEGVETPAHVQLLRTLGCDALQGYALAEPMSADAFLAYAQTEHARSA
ncbi:EAL domain-containing protein [Rhizobium sp. CC-YZS058]|uniref:bifunctional diguanylate cyclase/phosphodiesterase n=1 Tax=Rhizobium sp. CC-YZS058 TaxID=3042153 RepID=UPI002B139F82|nr:EAL domain-containing protein [Rhizobium sp. CC-YZS058]